MVYPLTFGAEDTRLKSFNQSREAPMDLFTTEGIAYTIQNFVIPGIAALLLMIAAFLLASWVKRMTFRSLEKTKLDLTLTKFFSNFARYGILIIAVVAILGYLGIETASFAAVGI
jgi:small conductance mechanosensitive channel